jgi:hypothetical protein
MGRHRPFFKRNAAPIKRRKRDFSAFSKALRRIFAVHCGVKTG